MIVFGFTGYTTPLGLYESGCWIDSNNGIQRFHAVIYFIYFLILVFSDIYMEIYRRLENNQPNNNQGGFRCPNIKTSTIGIYSSFCWWIYYIFRHQSFDIHPSIDFSYYRSAAVFIPLSSLMLHVIKEADFTIPYLQTMLTRLLHINTGSENASPAHNLVALEPRNLPTNTQVDLMSTVSGDFCSRSMSRSILTETTRGTLTETARGTAVTIQVQEAPNLHSEIPPQNQFSTSSKVEGSSSSLPEIEGIKHTPTISQLVSAECLTSPRKRVQFSMTYSDNGGVYIG